MKKRIVAFALAAVMAFSLVGCGKELSDGNVKVTKYKGLEVPMVEQTEITDEYVDQAAEGRVRASADTVEVTDRAVEMGDTVVIDYTGSVDGVEFEGGAATNANLVIGSNSFIGPEGDYQGFEEQIIGYMPGDEFDITVQFPADYSSEDLKGQVADFHIVLHSIQQQNIPEFNDEWVAKHSESSTTVEEYKKELKAELEESAKMQTETQLAQSALEALVPNVEVKEFKQDDLDARTAEANEYYQNYAVQYGMEFEEFCTTVMGMTMEDYNKGIEDGVKEMLKLEYAVKLIADKEHLEPSDEEYAERFDEFALSTGLPTEEFVKMVGEDTLKDMIRQEVVGKFLAENCVQVEQKN